MTSISPVRFTSSASRRSSPLPAPAAWRENVNALSALSYERNTRRPVEAFQVPPGGEVRTLAQLLATPYAGAAQPLLERFMTNARDARLGPVEGSGLGVEALKTWVAREARVKPETVRVLESARRPFLLPLGVGVKPEQRVRAGYFSQIVMRAGNTDYSIGYLHRYGPNLMQVGTLEHLTETAVIQVRR